MSELPDPQPAGRPRAITAGEQAVLDDLAGHENAADPGFVRRLNAPPRADPAGSVDNTVTTDSTGTTGGARSITRAHTEALARTRRRRAVQAAVLGGLLGLLLPTSWFLAGLLTAVLLLVPTALVVSAARAARSTDPPADPR